MGGDQIVDSSFIAIIDPSIDKIGIPAWCFGLPRTRLRESAATGNYGL
jgi:hypothetical protein